MSQHAQRSTVYSHWQIVFPEMANTHSVMFGGKLLAIMDMQAAVAGSLFCHSSITTVSIEAVDFLHPVYMGNRLETQAKIIFVSKTSLVVKIDCFTENHLTGDRLHSAVAYFNMVSINKDGKPQAAPTLLIETEEERMDFEKAKSLREFAIERRKQFKQR
jgi:acyl-CoA hydrolase